MPRRISLAALLFAATPWLAGAQVPAGGVFWVGGGCYAGRPSVALDARGNFVAAWETYSRASSFDVFAQRFDSAGKPQGGRFQVNAYTTGVQSGASVAADARGDFIVVWSSVGQDGSGSGVLARRYDPSSMARGPEFQVNTYTTGGQGSPSVAFDGKGNAVVVWQSELQDGSSSGLFGQRYAASGTPLGAEFQVNSYTTGSQSRPSVASGASGDFVVVWQSDGQDGSGSGVFGRRYDSSGMARGPEFQVNTYTTGGQGSPSVALDANGNSVVVWLSSGQDGDGLGVSGQRFDASGDPIGAEFQVNTYTTGDQWSPSVTSDGAGNFLVLWKIFYYDALFIQRFDASGAPREAELEFEPGPVFDFWPRVASDPTGNFVLVWPGSYCAGIFGQRFGGLLPSAGDVDAAATAQSDGNGVLEAGETVTVSPSWRNVNGAAQTFTGTASSFTGPGSPGDPVYTVVDGASDYGTVQNGATGGCSGGGDCYVVAVTAPAARPVQHWDAILTEDILPVALGQSKLWTLHVGDSFTDVPRSNSFYRFIETMLHNGVSAGCGATGYCPGSTVVRKQMAVFLLRARLGRDYTPPPAAGIFGDVPASDPFAPWVEDVYRRGIAVRCNYQPLLFCPNDAVSRRQMAELLLKTLLGSTYTPPPCTNPTFADVPCSTLLADWIYDLVARGITSGCGGGNYCPNSAVTRGQMSVFLARTFSLLLYGP